MYQQQPLRLIPSLLMVLLLSALNSEASDTNIDFDNLVLEGRTTESITEGIDAISGGIATVTNSN